MTQPDDRWNRNDGRLHAPQTPHIAQIPPGLREHHGSLITRRIDRVEQRPLQAKQPSDKPANRHDPIDDHVIASAQTVPGRRNPGEPTRSWPKAGSDPTFAPLNTALEPACFCANLEDDRRTRRPRAPGFRRTHLALAPMPGHPLDND